MQPSTKSLLMLSATLLLGVLLGAAGMAALGEGQPKPPPPAGGAGGFVAHMEATIQPRDSAQRALLLPILEATDALNHGVVATSAVAMRANLDSMQATLVPLLDAAQNDRLAELVRRLADNPPPPPRGGPPPPGGERRPPGPPQR